ncbi:hypothetical protein BDV29DRAFT_183856 [Aspergillus leporis]|uniref:Uncharacterized protein n=1 Tax=Aspergillus leporis TaxID=41062 RepID=A0A5N5WLZ4_9EURO|nr:hypothetical protein BDV29DRAFT_183856 [Aspergillus leporis]
MTSSRKLHTPMRMSSEKYLANWKTGWIACISYPCKLGIYAAGYTNAKSPSGTNSD